MYHFNKKYSLHREVIHRQWNTYASTKMHSSHSLFFTVASTVIESWMDVIMICCQCLGPDQTDEGVHMPSQLFLAMNGSWLSRVASLSNRPYLLCISNSGNLWITALARNNITILHLYTCISQTFGQPDSGGKARKGNQRREVLRLREDDTFVCVVWFNAHIWHMTLWLSYGVSSDTFSTGITTSPAPKPRV